MEQVIKNHIQRNDVVINNLDQKKPRAMESNIVLSKNANAGWTDRVLLAEIILLI